MSKLLSLSVLLSRLFEDFLVSLVKMSFYQMKAAKSLQSGIKTAQKKMLSNPLFFLLLILSVQLLFLHQRAETVLIISVERLRFIEKFEEFLTDSFEIFWILSKYCYLKYFGVSAPSQAVQEGPLLALSLLVFELFSSP